MEPNDRCEIGERVERQFAARYESFDGSARWVTDPTLLATFVEATDAGGRTVLEVCAGTARVGEALTHGGARVVASDLSPEMLMIARRRVAETQVADARRLPFADGSFARVVLRQAWHFLDPRVVPGELFRVLAPGGRLVTGQIVPFGVADADWLRRIHQAKQRDLDFFPTETSLAESLAAVGFVPAATREVLVEEEMNAWLAVAPETGPRVAEVLDLVRHAPEPYRTLHRVREDATGLWDTFRFVVLTLDKPLVGPRVRPELAALIACPGCGRTGLREDGERLVCRSCAVSVPLDAGVPLFRS